MILHLSVSHSVHRGVSTPLHAGIHSLGRHTLQADPPADTPFRYYRIRSTSGRNASYWNAFLFFFVPGTCGLQLRGFSFTCSLPGSHFVGRCQSGMAIIRTYNASTDFLFQKTINTCPFYYREYKPRHWQTFTWLLKQN